MIIYSLKKISSTVDIEFRQIKIAQYSDNQKTAEKEDDIKAILKCI